MVISSMALNLFNPLPPRVVHRACISGQLNDSVKAKNSRPPSERRSANYQPPIWNHNFLQSLKIDNTDQMYEGKAMKLEEEVRHIINNEDLELLTTLEMIDDIQRLGLGHRFEEDVRRNLDRITCVEGYCSDKSEKSLHATALLFRLLRQNGYEVSQACFERFMDDKGNFVASLLKDTKGMLSLYEASNIAFEGEHVLDKALAETTIHLKNHQRNTDSDITELISHSLELPLHRRMLMLEARWYIDVCNKKKEYANEALLQLAKMNFNMTQSVLQRDLQEMFRWWSDLGLARKLSFSRDRLMECFFWTVGMAFEPQFSSCRKGLTKVTSFITTIDDVYDVYGTIEELELFTNAVERWDVNKVGNLPDYMKLCFLALYNTVNEMAYHNLKDQGEHVMPYLTKAWADLCKAFLQEARWSTDKTTPSFEDYVENAWRSVSGTVILIHAFFLLGENVSQEALDCLVNYHELLCCSSMIFRLCNDLGTSSAEVLRGETANAISCYMYENGVTEEHARQHIHKLIDKAWKKMNTDQIDKTPFAKTFRETAINLARIAQCTYQHGDGHGAPDATSKNRVVSLIIEPIPIMEP